jgi:hypothetical protein
VIADNDREEQQTLKGSTLLTNAVIFHTTLDMNTIRELGAEGWEITLEDLSVLSPT